MRNKELHTVLSQHGSFAVRYFTFKYEKLPIIKTFKARIDTKELVTKMKAKYSNNDFEIRHGEDLVPNASGGNWHFADGNVLCTLKKEFLFYYEFNFLVLCYSNAISLEEVKEIESILFKCRQFKQTKNRFSMIKKREFGEYELTEFKTKKVNNNINENYNEDLTNLHPQIIKFINSKDTNGIILFHGAPGTGKTSYIRSLIKECKSRFIFLPNNLFSHISEPDFIAFISAHQNAVIILEDCEELLKPREQNNSGNGISNLLNLGDGLLGDALKLKIICTFNCSLSKIDEAMLRKGRLMFRYEFKPLEDEKVNQLLKSLKIETQTTEPMVLADVFHFAHNNGSTMEKKAIGFVGG